MQDSKGYMWFGTETGACRFDGKKFTRFTMDDGLSDNEIFQIHEDSKGRIWFITFNGKLSFFKDEVFHNPDNDEILRKAIAPSNHLLSFYEDHRKALWIGTFGNGLIHIDGDSVSLHELGESRYDGKGLFVLEDSAEMIWGVRPHELVRIEGHGIIDKISLDLSFDHATLRQMESGDLLFLNSDSTVYLLSRLNLQAHAVVKPGPNVHTIHNYYIERNGDIWICTARSGCFKYMLENGTYKLSEELLKGKTVYSVFVDDEGNTWITTAGEGIYMLPGDYKNYYSYTMNDGLAESQINSIAKDKTGNTWLGLSNSKINILTANGLKYYASPLQQDFYNRIVSICVDEHNSVWCAADKGLWIFKNNIRSPPVLVYDTNLATPKHISQNPITKEIEVTFSGGIAKITEDSSQPSGYGLTIDSVFTYQRNFTHNFDHHGNRWIGTIEGLNFYDGVNLVKYGRRDKLLRSRITDIEEFLDSIMVIATYGQGVIFMQGGKIIQHLTTADALSGNICRQIFIKDSFIWVATNLGLSKVVSDGSSFRVRQNFNSKSGLLSDNVTGIVDDGSRLYVATDKGLSIVNKNAIAARTSPPFLYITGITTDDGNYKTSGIPEISHQNQRIVLEFIAITFKNPSEVKYEYRLKGNSNNWTETKNNSVEFSALIPGTYNFELRAKKIDSDWSPVTQMSFTIIPPYWNTYWFRLVIGSLFIFGLYTWIRYSSTRKLRHQLQVAKQKQAIEAERSRIATDMHDDLGSDLTKITIWSNIIESEDERIENIKPLNREISATANSLLKKMDEIIWTLNPTNDSLVDLTAYLRQFTLNFFEGTSAKCYMAINDDIPEMTVPSALRRNIFLVVKESLNNIIKHAGATQVGVDLEISGRMMKITIVDNGKGFETTGTSQERHGILNLRKRMADIGGTIKIKSEKGKGTLIRISAPLERMEQPA